MVNYPPILKFEIIEKFQETNNKTATAQVFGVSPRTVGRIVKEYEGLESPYTDIYKLANQLILPKNLLSDFDETEVDLDDVLDKIGVSGLVTSLDVTFEQVLFDEPVLTIDESNHGLDEEEPVEVPAESNEYDYEIIASPQTITITRVNDDDIESVDVAKGTEEFRTAWKMIREIDIDNQDEVNQTGHEIWLLVDKAYKLEVFSQGKITVDPAGECIVYDGNLISNKLTDRIMTLLKERGQDGVQLLVNFLEKLMENPSYRAVNSLYDFLLHNDIEIIENGNFYAWKRVRANMTDVHSGEFDNSVGSTVEMPRNLVNEDPEQTCSAGLHVAARHYLRSFSGPVVVKCEVDPRDVVAIPRDYNNSKMRVCRYKVVENVTEDMRGYI
jgi:hypothetical protein